MYRAYTLNTVNHIENAVWIDAGSDKEALAKVQEMNPVRCEVWDRARLVGRIEPASQKYRK